MTNVVSITTKDPVKVQTLEEHLENVKQELIKHPGVSKAFTVLIDEAAGTWQLHPVYCNMTNGALFMAMGLMNYRIVHEVHDV